MKELADVVINAPKSKIRKLFDLAAGKTDVISLGIGQPDFPSPQSLIDGTIDALNERKTVYAPTRGLPELKQAIAKKLKRDNGIEVDAEKNIIIANGGSQAITLSYGVLLNPGDEIIISSPNFISYYYCSRFFRAEPLEIKRNDDFSINFEEMRKRISEKTKAIIINSPNNPSGYVYSRKDWEQLVQIVVENDLYLISDEPYEHFIYDDHKMFSPASVPEIKDQTITLNCISKTYAAPGFRLGYAVANPEIINLMEKYMQYTVAGVNYPAQYGALRAMEGDQTFFEPIKKSYEERRNYVYERLLKMGFSVNKPGGAFYIFPSVSNFNTTADNFAMRLMEAKSVAVVPGDIFGSYSSDKIRISFATSMKNLEEAMNRMEEFTAKL